MENKQPTSFMTLPGAIIIAGAIIAIAIIYVKKPITTTPSSERVVTNKEANVSIKDVSAGDHILGNPNAPVKIVEYSDPSCPYCKTFNPTMEKIMEEYGPTGKVAWVYRHFPLDKPDQDGNILHKNAGHEAQALECAASVGGNSLFWAFEKNLYAKTPSVTQATPQGLDQATLPNLAKEVGIDPKAFSDCLASGKSKSKVEGDYLDAVNAGITGTPYSIIITPAGSKIPLVGAQSYQTIKNALDTLLTDSQ